MIGRAKLVLTSNRYSASVGCKIRAIYLVVLDAPEKTWNAPRPVPIALNSFTQAERPFPSNTRVTTYLRSRSPSGIPAGVEGPPFHRRPSLGTSVILFLRPISKSGERQKEAENCSRLKRKKWITSVNGRHVDGNVIFLLSSLHQSCREV